MSAPAKFRDGFPGHASDRQDIPAGHAPAPNAGCRVQITDCLWNRIGCLTSPVQGIMTGRIEQLWSKRAHRGPMDPVSEATLVVGQGVQGSVGRSKRRQITLLSLEAWDAATSSIGHDPGPSSRRANVLVSGVELANTRGRVLRVGACRVSIGGELTPCERMDEASAGLRQALQPEWRGGVFAQVIEGGIVRVGDLVEWEAGP
jgi:hypothetical protein